METGELRLALLKWVQEHTILRRDLTFETGDTPEVRRRLAELVSDNEAVEELLAIVVPGYQELTSKAYTTTNTTEIDGSC